MAKGAFTARPDPLAPPHRDISFTRADEYEGEIPEDQATLRDDVERTLRILRGLFPNGGDAFDQFFDPLLKLAQGGVVGKHAEPTIAARQLKLLQDELLQQEAGRVKNAYLRKLGWPAACFATLWIVLHIVTRVGASYGQVSVHGVIAPEALANLSLVLAACAAGVWLSFGARKD